MDKKLTIVEEADLGLKLCESGNLEEGIKHLRIAAENNHLHAMVNLGHALKLYGDYEEVFKWTLGFRILSRNIFYIVKCLAELV